MARVALRIPPRSVLAVWRPEIVSAATALLQAVEAWRGRARITSWWRSIDRNAIVKGADWSQHLVGLAFDLVVEEGDREALVALLEARGWTVLRYTDHLHLQWLPYGRLRELVESAGDPASLGIV